MQVNARVRTATPEDADAIAAIYAPYVLESVTSFELEAPDPDEIRRRREEILELGLPYLVAEIEGEIAGYSYASRFRPRPAYRFTVENSVYVGKRYQRRGVARQLMHQTIADCTNAGIREMIAMVAEPAASIASVMLHRSLNFQDVGLLRGVGEKFGRSVDVLIMQKSLVRR